jgi:hypothetical protein
MQTVVPVTSPGEETSIVDPELVPGGLTPDTRWVSNLHRYQLYGNLLSGGDDMLRPPSGMQHPISGAVLADNSYLTRLPAESSYLTSGTTKGEDSYALRIDAGCHHPVAARIIWVYVDTLFRQHIDRSGVEASLGPECMTDVDGRGTDAADWLAGAYAQGLGHGWCVGLCDMPSTTPDTYASRAEQDVLGGRPYLQLILPIRVWQLEQDEWGRITRMLVHEAENRWRLWTPTESVVYEGRASVMAGKVVVQKAEAVTRTAHSWGRVPAEMFIACDPNPNDPEGPWGVSAMKATALIDLRILNALSLLDDDLRKTGYPLLHVQRDPLDGAEPDMSVGSGFALYVDANVEWKSPPPDLARVLWEHIEQLESLAYKVGGVHRRSQDSVEAHSGLALDWENAPIYATVQRWARRLREWEIRLWRLMAQGLGVSATGIDVVYPDDFSTRPAEADVATAKALLEPYGTLGAAPDFVQIAVQALHRRAIQRLIGSDPDVRRAIEGATLEAREPMVPPAFQKQDEEKGDDGDAEASTDDGGDRDARQP